MSQQKQQFIQPELKTFSFAVSDYFTRDKNDKNAAAIAMAMSQLDQNDIWQFVERLLIECEKYPTIKSKKEELKKLYYGKGNLPNFDVKPIPLYFLKSDALTSNSKVRIRGAYSGNEIKEVISWSVWQVEKSLSSKVIMDKAAEIINEIDRINNFSDKLKSLLDKVDSKCAAVKESFEVEVKDLISTDYIEKDDRNFSKIKKDFMTFKRDSPDPASRKFKIYSRDYFYNLQILISQSFNATDFKESMFHLSRVAAFIESSMATKSKNKIMIVKPKNSAVFVNFIDLVSSSSLLGDLMTNHQYLTSDERISLNNSYYNVRSTLMYCGTKLMSLVNHILTIIPYNKKSSAWSTDGVLE